MFQNYWNHLIQIYRFYCPSINIIIKGEKQMASGSNRIFYDILLKIGGMGDYQRTSLFFWSLLFMTSGSTGYLNSFLYHQIDYQCPSYIQNCKDYVCSLPQQQRNAYLTSSNSSLASDFGDFRCDGSLYIETLQSFIYIGGLFGLMAGAFLGEYFSKRQISIGIVVVNICGCTIAILANSLLLASVGLFLNYTAKCVTSQIVPCIISDVVHEDHRGKQTMLIYIFFAVGVTLNGAVFLLISDWRMGLLLYQILPNAVALFGIVFYVRQTPFDAITYFEAEKAYKDLSQIAKINKKPQNAVTLAQIAEVKKEYEENQRQKHDFKISIIDLFRYDSLRTITVVSLILHFLISYSFNLPQMVVKDYAIDIHWSSMILGFSQVIASLLSFFVINVMKRKSALYVAQVGGLLASVPIFLFASCSTSVEVCGSAQSIIQICGMFVFRFFATLGYNFFYVNQFQLFPTQIRVIALQFIAISGTIAIVVGPLLQKMFENIGISIIITFWSANILMILAIMGIPQTFEIPPSQMITQLNYQHHKQCVDKYQTKQKDLSNPNTEMKVRSSK